MQLRIIAQGGPESDTTLASEFPLSLDALHMQFLLIDVLFSLKWRRSSSADVNKFCFYVNKL